MSQKYTLISRKNPVNPTAEPKFYAHAKTGKRVSVKEICARVSERSSFSKGELEGTIKEFLLEVEHVMQEGNTALLGDLGSFRLSIRSEGAPSEEKFTKANIKDSKVIFRPGTSLRKLCKTMEYELYKPDTAAKDPDQTPAE